MDTFGVTQSHPGLAPNVASCRVCGSTVNLRRCSNCKSAFYCSQTHQQTDWRNHRIECKLIRSQYDTAMLNKVNAAQFQSVPDHTQYPIVHATAAQSYGEAATGWQQPSLDQPAYGVGTAATSVGSQAYLPDSLSEAENGVQQLAGDKLGATFEVAAAQMQADREKKVRDFRSLSENTMRINDVHLTNVNVMAR